MNTKQFLSDILDEFNKIDYVKPEAAAADEG